jgi:hypothetical protein
MNNDNYTNLNVWLTITLVLFIAPWVLIPYKIISVPDSIVTPVLLAALLSGLIYYVILGLLVSKKNRSVIKWVGLSFIFSPVGHIVSYVLILKAEPIQRVGYL